MKTSSLLPLKERLLAFRTRHLGEALPEAPKPAVGRLGDILKPILQIIQLVRPEREESFLKLVNRLRGERQIEKSDSIEAHVLRALIQLGGCVKHGTLPVKMVTDRINEGRVDRFQVTPHRIGRRLSALGFQRARTGDGAAAVIYDDQLIE